MSRRFERESEIVSRLRQRNETAVTELADTYGAKIFQLALRCTENREDAEEVTQDVLLCIYQKISTFRGDAALSSWIYRIAFNAAMARLRRRRAKPMAISLDDATSFASDGRHAHSIVDWSPHAEDQLLRRELQSVLRRSILELPAIYRRAVVLCDVEGRSGEEAAAILGVKYEAFKSRLHRGRLVLRERLSAYIGSHQPSDRPNRPPLVPRPGETATLTAPA